MPKPVLATAEELRNAEGQLKNEIGRVKSEVEGSVQKSADALREEIRSVQVLAGNNATKASDEVKQARTDSKTYTDESLKGLNNSLRALLPPIEQKILAAQQETEGKLQAVDTQIRRIISNELSELAKTFHQQLTSDKEELQSTMENFAKGAAEHTDDTKRELKANLQEAADKAELDTKKMGETSAAILVRHTEAQKKIDEKQDERAQRTSNEIYLKLDDLYKLVKECQETTESSTSKVAEEAQHNLAEFRDGADKQLAFLDEEARRLRSAMSEVENTSTRRVEWVIQKVSKKVRPLSPSRAMLHCSWFSPKFDAAGAHGLQLELQLFRQSDPPVDGEDAGDCAVHLWACKGMNLAYKLYVGKKHVNLEKVFNGRVPYGTKRFCWLREEINKEDDTLTVGVEILEAIREVQHPVKPPPPPVFEEGESEELRKVKQEQAQKHLDGSVFFYRSVNNRILDQVKHQVEIMQSRMVRKIEWRVENASLLRRCFPQGEAICSMAFSAAGVDGMQLIFYPSGYNSATEGFCSLFLFAPAGATLSCWLSAGTQRRDASHTFEEPGAFGRTNFCRYESCIDEAEDVIMIALDIQDAQQDMRATVSHPTVQPGDRRTQPEIDGSAPHAIDSVVKLTKVPRAPPGGHQKKAASGALALEERKLLPSLWTAQSLSALGQGQEAPGYHNFDELKQRGRRGNKNNLSTSTAGATMQSSASMPSMGATQGVGRSAMQEDLISPLPSLSRTYGADWERDYPGGADASRGKKGARPRRLRSEASTGSLTTTGTMSMMTA
mmetsp:Transcript_41401/g.72713  ORF Transcript_41401/g.72713 Transcript_41401/m.72713 type:complete len:783 (-) Transcript_41401:104-2452(-)